MAGETADREEISLLIVEDELILAEDLAMTVKDLGYQVAAIASTGEEAIRLAADAMPSLVLMDVTLAGEIDGIQASEKIRSDYDLPVIFLTAYDGDDVLCRAKRTEPYGYLTKPVSHNILKITIETVLYKHRAEKRARDSEERLRLAMEASADGIWDWDIVTGAAYYSPSYFSMLGLEPGKHPTNFKTWVELMHAEDLNRALADNQDCIDGKTDCFATEFRMLHHDGTWRWILGRGKAVARDIEGKATRMVGTHTDITHRKIAEIALRESRNELEDRVAKRTAQLRFANEQLLEEIVERESLEDALRRSETRYRAIFEGAAEGILLADPQTMRFKLANPAMCRMLGYAEKELPALRIPDILPEDELDGVLDDFRAISTKAKSETHDVRCLRKDGTSFYADIVASHTTINEKEYLIGFFSDVTERRNASEALKRSDGMLRAVLDQMPSGVAIRDAHTGLVILANEKCREIMGSALKTLSEFERYHFSRSDGSLYRNQEMPIFRSMASGELIDSEEVVMQADDGSLRTVSISSAPVRDSAGHIIMGVGVFDDITERKRAEEALRESEARFRSIFESATECIYITDKKFSVTHVNPACTSLFGRPSSEMVGMGPADLYGPQIGNQIADINARVLLGERIEHQQVRMIGGTAVHFHDIRVPLRDDRMDLIGMCCFSRYSAKTLDGNELLAMSANEYPSRAMQRVLRTARLAAKSKSIVLLQGESGSGKDYLALWIHKNSPWAPGPFVSVNCAAIPRELAESELFGHERGAFTGATVQKKGQLELAEGGTILLNEIGELDLALQAKLLTFLDTSSFLRVGGQKQVRVNARLLAATHRDLVREVSEGRFLEPLFYRIGVLSIEVPPLRERLEDLPILVNEVMRRVARGTDLANLPTIDEKHLKALSKYHWPGNVRELRNVMERSLLLWNGDRLNLAIETGMDRVPSSDIRVRYVRGKTLREAHQEVTAYFVGETLRHCDGDKTKAAYLLGISRDSIYRYIKQIERWPKN